VIAKTKSAEWNSSIRRKLSRQLSGLKKTKRERPNKPSKEKLPKKLKLKPMLLLQKKPLSSKKNRELLMRLQPLTKLKK
jgi:hypothetical protein